ncbi:unnamed protein product [Kuraishia capsulata CBS 1993]|uniref:SMP-LTD domain-containing protein n=1 Tax=Kuraishia capsulata CBS 1993 TaxID=1382522 RepID=W6MLE7_9ASCO|nr:uncharacterized protein KUCA_T00002910001 [Kuraishia capsulata CBS 1993]CDK26933.1 unnamed protein product [Kuraishia capsulata CBS 1993]
MNSLLLYLYIYVVGGLTFIPLVCLGIILILKHTLPVVPDDVTERERLEEEKREKDSVAQGNPEGYLSLKGGEIQDSTGLDTFMTGWLTVTREFYQFPQINPNEHGSNTAAGSTNDHSEGGERNGTSISSFVKIVKGEELQNQQPVPVDNKKLKAIRKKCRFFAVLKHGNLFLYKDEDQKNVQQVIVLSHHVVSIWPLNRRDGQLFTKRSAVCLLRSDSPSEKENIYKALASKEIDHSILRGAFYLYGDLNVEKEDWYFALLRATTKATLKTNKIEVDSLEPSLYARTLHFHTSDMNELIKTLNSTPGQLSTRWLNALIGRLFLAFQGTDKFQKIIIDKVITKLQKINKPGFLDDFQITRLSVGHGGPFITFPTLDTLSPDGDLVVKFNMLYQGGLTLEIATKAYLNLTSRFKPREVALNLKIQLRKMEGVMVLKMKKPPSNRIWYAFEKMPSMDLVIEPVVSSRSLNYNLVTNIIENKFREAIRESLVMPFMDDFVLYDTLGEIFRGGIWDLASRPQFEGTKTQTEETPNAETEDSTNAAPPPLPLRDLEESLEPESDLRESLPSASPLDDLAISTGARQTTDDNMSISSRTRPSSAILKNFGERASSVFSKKSDDDAIPSPGVETDYTDFGEVNIPADNEDGSVDSGSTSASRTATRYSQNMSASVQKLRGWYTKEKKSFQSFRDSKGQPSSGSSEHYDEEKPAYTAPEMIQSRRQVKPKLSDKDLASKNTDRLDDTEHAQYSHYQSNTHNASLGDGNFRPAYEKAPDMVIASPNSQNSSPSQPRNGVSMFTRKDDSAFIPSPSSPSSVSAFHRPAPPPLPSRLPAVEIPIEKTSEKTAENPVEKAEETTSDSEPVQTAVTAEAKKIEPISAKVPPPLPSRELPVATSPPPDTSNLERAKSGRIRRQHTDRSEATESEFLNDFGSTSLE